MTPETIVRNIKTKVPTHYGRRMYAVVGSYQQLLVVEKALQDAGLPKPVAVNSLIMETLECSRLDRLTKFEAHTRAAITSELTTAYRRILQAQLQTADLVILKEFELLFQYGVDLNVARNYAIEGKAVIMLVPGHQDSGTIFAYSSCGLDGTEFFPGLFDPAHIWEVD